MCSFLYPIARLGFAIIVVLAVGLGCSRQGATAVPGTEPEAEPKNYQEMLDRTRARQEVTSQVDEIRLIIAQFQHRLGRTPTNLYELVKLGFVENIPIPPKGFVLSYNPVHGNVDLVNTQRVTRTEQVIPAPSLSP